jgi:hypothetical protein
MSLGLREVGPPKRKASAVWKPRRLEALRTRVLLPRENQPDDRLKIVGHGP